MEKKKTLRFSIISVTICTVVILLLVYLFSSAGSPAVDELLKEAEQAFISEDYLDALKIYLDESLKQDPVALNNLGYMLVIGTGAAKDIPKGLEYYKQAANLGNSTALDNYILTILQHPTTYDAVLEALEWGHKENSSIVDSFVERLVMSPQIVNQCGKLHMSAGRLCIFP